VSKLHTNGRVYIKIIIYARNILVKVQIGMRLLKENETVNELGKNDRLVKGGMKK